MRWMRKAVSVTVVGLVLVAVTSRTAAQGRGENASVVTMPPVVVRTMPQSGDTKVDAAKVKEIRVTFSKEMTDRSWSWSQISDETALPISGSIHYQKNKRTCVAPVKLEPGRTYVSWINSQQFGNFKDAGGRSAVPYLLVFETKPAGE